MGKSSSHALDDPDRGPYAMDVEGGAGGRGGKVADQVRSDLYEAHEALRGDARMGDTAVETLPGLTRAKRDLERAYPRSHVKQVPTNAKRRRLQAEGEFRANLSSRQRKVRAKTKRAAQDAMPNAQHRDLAGMISSDESMGSINGRLHQVHGNARRLTDSERQKVQRIDRAIANYERNSDRGHVVYFGARMDSPPTTPSEIPDSWQPGRTLSLDEYTMSTHTIHEVDRQPGADKSMIFELETTRGMYFGRSDSADDTRHLLPRGMHTEVVSSQYVPFERPGGPPGDRLVIQLREVPTPKGTSR